MLFVTSIRDHLYYRLIGTTPFAASTIEEILESNKKCVIKVEESAWHGVSPEARELFILMTSVDPDKRPTADSVLNHPWFSKDFTSAEVLVSALVNMRKHSKDYVKQEGLGSILTSSPLLGGRALPEHSLRGSDSPAITSPISQRNSIHGTKVLHQPIFTSI